MPDGTLYSDQRSRAVAVPVADTWRVVETIGGDRGWYAFDAAWALRGGLDRLIGGIGLRRGRRDPDRLVVGDTVDFWRVEQIVPGRLLRLRAEMSLPGTAWLQFDVAPTPAGPDSVLTQTSSFRPRGWVGHAYWHAVAPLHGVVFASMLAHLAAAAQTIHAPPDAGH
jgi:Protein of unknown function (DUF2867)